jgi:hypothetical protein
MVRFSLYNDQLIAQKEDIMLMPPDASTYLSADQQDHLAAFGDYLTEIGYADSQTMLMGMPYRYLDAPEFIRRLRAIVPRDLRLALRLFALGEPVATEELDHSGLRHFLPTLRDCGLLNMREGQLRTNSLRCQVVDGCYLFVSQSRGPGEILAYFGDDSIKLTRHLQGHMGQRALDACCGSGIQSILLARLGLTVVGVDIQEAVLHLARINCAINNVSARTTFYHADLADFHPTDTFDIIVTNPPLLPIPAELRYTLVGDGGENGLGITRRVIELFMTHSAPQARATLIGLCLGSDKTVELTALVQALGCQTKYACQIWLINRLEAAKEGHNIVLTSSAQFGESYSHGITAWAKLCTEHKANFVYTYLLTLTKGTTAPGLQIIPLYEKGAPALWYVY